MQRCKYLPYLHMLAKGDVEMLYAASSVSRGKHSLHCIVEHEYGQGFTSFPLSSTSAEYDGVWSSAGSAPLTPVLFVCIFLVILAPVSSSAHYLLQLFPRSDFFLLSNEWVLKCSEVQYFPQNILK